MAKKLMIDVVLTPEARESFATERLRYGLRQGRSFSCESAEESGSFLAMRVAERTAITGAVTHFTISIPVRYVLYMISASPEDRKALGFKDDDDEKPAS